MVETTSPTNDLDQARQALDAAFAAAERGDHEVADSFVRIADARFFVARFVAGQL